MKNKPKSDDVEKSLVVNTISMEVESEFGLYEEAMTAEYLRARARAREKERDGMEGL
jgi:hypothetical protein